MEVGGVGRWVGGERRDVTLGGGRRNVREGV